MGESNMQHTPALHDTLLHPALIRLVPSMSKLVDRPTPRSTPPPPSLESDLTYDATIETTLRFAQARLCTPRASISDLSSIYSSSSRNSSSSNLSNPVSQLRCSDNESTTSLGEVDNPGRSCIIRIVRPGQADDRNRSIKTTSTSTRKTKRLSRHLSRAEIAAESTKRKQCMRRFV